MAKPKATPKPKPTPTPQGEAPAQGTVRGSAWRERHGVDTPQ